MFEGKNIHYSPTDNKPLCSYSGKLCRQRRLNGYAFCIRHILEDKSAPFKQCSYVTRNNSQKCLNAIPSNQDRGYCHSHLQVVGIIPKTERKSKAQPVKSDSLSSCGSDKSLTSPTTPTSSSNGKKDPGAVFKFEEDSSDPPDLHFTYKNGLSHISLANGKGKGSKGSKKDTTTSYSPKDGKKTSNGITGSYTTKKITDRNKNVYTAIIPTNNSNSINNNNCNANNNNNHEKTELNNKKNSRKGSSSADSNFSTVTTTPAAKKISSKKLASISTAESTTKRDCVGESKLNKNQDVEELRQFEQLKTLKPLDKCMLAATTITTTNSESPRIFPRLASAKLSGVTCSTSAQPQSPPSYLTSPSNPPAPASVVITRSPSNGTVVNTVNSVGPNHIEDKEANKEDLSSSPRSNNNYNDNCSEVNDVGYCNSIDDDSQEDSRKSRHAFLAQVRNSFMSQYKSLKKSSKLNGENEKKEKENFREMLMKCVKIDSSICAQVLLGYGLKVPVFSEGQDQDPSSLNNNNSSKKSEYDYYEFFDSDSLSEPATKTNTADFSDLNTTKSRKGGGGKKNNGITNKSETVKEKVGKGSNRKTGQQKKSSTSSDSPVGNGTNGSLETDTNNAHDVDNPTKTLKNGKKAEKVQVDEFPKNQKGNRPNGQSASKRKLKRTDPPLSTENSVGSYSESYTKLDSIHSPLQIGESIENGKRRKLTIISGMGVDILDQGTPSTIALVPSPFGLGMVVNDNHNQNPVTATASEVHIKTDSQCESDSNIKTHFFGGSQQGLPPTLKEIQDILNRGGHHFTSRRNQGLETVLNSVGSSENAGTPDGVITDASFDSTFDHSTSSHQDCEFSEDDLEHSFELQIDPEIESQASRLLEDNVLTEEDFTELFPDNRMSDHKFGRNDLQELGLDFDVNDIDYSLFANNMMNFSRSGGQPESISISNQF